MGIGNGVVIRFLADTGGAVRNIGKLEGATGRAMTTGKKFSAVWAKAGPALAGVAAAAGAAVVAIGVEGVKAAAENQSSQQKLARAMQNTTDATAEQIAAMEEYIDIAQRKTGMDDGELRKGVGTLIRYTKNGGRAQALSNVAIKIALERGLDYLTVVKALAKANDGNTTALKKLGIPIGTAAKNYGDLQKAQDQVTAAQQRAAAVMGEYGPSSSQYAASLRAVSAAKRKLDVVRDSGGIKWLAELNAQFRGAVADDAKTYAGGLRRVTTAWDELVEAFGTGLIGGDGPPGQMQELADAMYEAQPTAESLGESVRDIAQGLADTLVYLGPIVDKFNELNDLGDGFLTNGLIANTIKAINGDVTNPQPVYNTTKRTPEQTAALIAAAQAQAAAKIAGYSDYRPMATTQRYRDATRGADARSAQSGARTRTRP